MSLAYYFFVDLNFHLHLPDKYFILTHEKKLSNTGNIKMSKNILPFLLLLLFIVNQPIFAQTDENYENGKYVPLNERLQSMKPINLIDCPTANLLMVRRFQLKMRVYEKGGMLAGLVVRLTPGLMFGVSYGGQNIIGHGKVNWNEAPGVNVRYQMRMEDLRFPGISLGFDSQGYGTYYPDLKRYQIKSKGLYVVASKNYSLLKDLGLHGGINYSTENKESEKDINFFIGAHLMVDRQMSLFWEYDFAINDNADSSMGTGKGYMNVAVRWAFSSKLLLEFSIKNLLKNNKKIPGVAELPNEGRELKIIYVERL